MRPMSRIKGDTHDGEQYVVIPILRSVIIAVNLSLPISRFCKADNY